MGDGLITGKADALDFESLVLLRKAHPAWRLLAADHAPLIASFLDRAFIHTNVRTLSQQALRSELEDFLFQLRERLGQSAFPKSASEYLEDWAADGRGWLRKYYPPGGDEPHFDITTATEKAIGWLRDLRQKQLVATESRLLMVFDLLRQMVHGTSVDADARTNDLMSRRAKIDAELARLREGRMDLLDDAQVKDRFLQMATTASGLLSDFREVEQNFRDLDRTVRERIAGWDGAKGALLQDMFGDRDAINDSDQGRTFRAFWDFLMSPARQEELTSLLETVLALPTVQSLGPDGRLARVHYDWLSAGEVAQRTVARLSEQLRRYLDDQTRLENRRVMQILRSIEHSALLVRHCPPGDAFMVLDEQAPEVDLPLDRPLFSPPLSVRLTSSITTADGADVPSDALYGQAFVDKTRLAAQIRRALQTRFQISLADLLTGHPLEQGLAELVTYMSLAAEDNKAVIDDRQQQTITWVDDRDVTRQATLPLIIFSR